MNAHDHNEETIVAIATALAVGQGGIAVIRISGPAANEIGQNIVTIPGEQAWSSHNILYGYVLDEAGTERIDEVLVLIMKGPRSFTGEDIVEIHCHGGLIAVQRVLKRVLNHKKARRALPGEFSQRAVLNGRMKLTQAEAINDLVGARTLKAAQIAMTGVDGGIQKQINSLREILLDQLTELEARVDFEDELPILDGEKLLNELLKVKASLEKLIEDGKRGACLQQGLRVAIIGRPNVGKSSLLNLLSKRNKAIVTSIPGTTRDSLESDIILENVPFTLIDTAGIRTTEDEVEKLGIEKSKEALAGAEVIIMIFDLTSGWTTEDEELLINIPPEIPKLIVGNKSDIVPLNKSKDTSHIRIEAEVTISALTGSGEALLIDSLLKKCGASDIQNIIFALNERQRDLASLAANALARTQEAAKQKLPWDFWTIDLREAISILGEITGEEITEDLLNRVFSKFCIGK